MTFEDEKDKIYLFSHSPAYYPAHPLKDSSPQHTYFDFLSNPNARTLVAISPSCLRNYLLALLENLAGIAQSPRFHPEGDALFHSLQVFELARTRSDDPQLWTAALLHDVGKAMDYPGHDIAGAEALSPYLSPRITWLVRHHLDLLKSPTRTRRRHKQRPQLRELEQLRRWDLDGRQPDARVMDPGQAVDLILRHHRSITDPDCDPYYRDSRFYS